MLQNWTLYQDYLTPDPVLLSIQWTTYVNTVFPALVMQATIYLHGMDYAISSNNILEILIFAYIYYSAQNFQ